jgi:hypothetical protein
MPGGPYVEEYSLTSSVGPRLTEYGQYPLIVDLQVRWKPEITEAVTHRRTLLGSGADELNRYHGQAAIAYQVGLLAELQRKCNRAKLVYDRVKGYHADTNPRWFNFYKEIHQYLLDNMHWDQFYVQKYIAEHATSTAIPGTRWFKSKRWSQLEVPEQKHLYELGKAYWEDLLANWDELTNMIVQPNAIGRGIRARSPDVTGIDTSYHFEIPRARQVGFAPWFSTQHAFLGKDVELKVWEKIRDFAEKELGCEVILPPLRRGAYWSDMDQLIRDNPAFVNGDGSQSELNIAIMNGMYNYASDDGVPQWISGTTPTSFATTWSWLQSIPVRCPGLRLTAVGGIGDDQVFIGSKDAISRVQNIPGVWEIDPIGTKYKCLLGVVILDEGKGTFPGLYRITVDRAEKKIPFFAGESLPNEKHPDRITGDIPADSFAVYREIMEHGTLKDTPMLDYIAKHAEEDFYRAWRMTREETLTQMGSNGLDVLPDDYEIDSY